MIIKLIRGVFACKKIVLAHHPWWNLYVSYNVLHRIVIIKILWQYCVSLFVPRRKIFKTLKLVFILQSELMSKAEENRHVSLCLEDAMKETNELKSQVSWNRDGCHWWYIPSLFSYTLVWLCCGFLLVIRCCMKIWWMCICLLSVYDLSNEKWRIILVTNMNNLQSRINLLT